MIGESVSFVGVACRSGPAWRRRAISKPPGAADQTRSSDGPVMSSCSLPLNYRGWLDTVREGCRVEPGSCRRGPATGPGAPAPGTGSAGCKSLSLVSTPLARPAAGIARDDQADQDAVDVDLMLVRRACRRRCGGRSGTANRSAASSVMTSPVEPSATGIGPAEVDGVDDVERAVP